MGYASKRINSDPKPHLDRNGGHPIRQQWPEEWTEYDPRPEYDNNYNPILVDMREFYPVLVDEWLVALDDPWFIDGVPKELYPVANDHIEHARKVLSRLATFKMSQPEGKA